MVNGETQETRKNIVLCSDGTGQTGARVGGTNVWKIRMGIDRDDHLTDESVRRQIMFYDAGVGTAKLSLKRMLGAAFGYGLSANIRLLYTNLAKTYNDGDNIYLFGFSRGAFTARSLAGFISEVGVIDGRKLKNDVLEDLVNQAFKAYRASPGNNGYPEPSVPVEDFRKKHRDIIQEAPVHFVGVWDTVDAYGMPVDELRDLIYKNILYKIRRPHNDSFTKNGKMKYAYQALAIDEDRRTFTPTVYDEQRAKECGVTCEQVWFAGAHSNVGGGYARQGLSDVALYWMMTKAQACGLRFTDDAFRDVRRDRDGNSTLYDQRSGAGLVYRYLPRDLGKLCGDANTPVRIHVSAMDRIELATADYAPITLPADFEVVGSDEVDKKRVAKFNARVKAGCRTREDAIKPAWKEIQTRRWLYRLFLTVLLVLVILIGWLMFGDDAVKKYQANSPTHTVLVWLGDQMPSVMGPAADLWNLVGKGAVALSPGLSKHVTEAVFEIPGVLVFILVAGGILLRWHNRRVAKLKHFGLDLWRKCKIRAAE